jgi:glucoamylase
LAAAEFCFRAVGGGAGARAQLERGDAFLETVRSFTPPSGDLSEQFDQNTGAQSSARQLAWSYAAFISCIAARRAVVA